jgi:uncharacterized protein (TIGR03083 family)
MMKVHIFPVEELPPVMLPDLIFTAQSAALRVWIGTLDEPDLAAPSTLPGWTVADLVGHLVAVHDAVAALRPVQDATEAGAAAEAGRTLGALGAADRLVDTRRGPMLASAYLTTRVIELVVHAGDLHGSVPARPAPPVLPAARQHVLTALREALTARSADPDVLVAASDLDEQQFVDLATGRADPAAPVPEALRGLLPLL